MGEELGTIPLQIRRKYHDECLESVNRRNSFEVTENVDK